MKRFIITTIQALVFAALYLFVVIGILFLFSINTI